jgi:phosphoribosylglycinamide formyltransferase-1
VATLSLGVFASGRGSNFASILEAIRDRRLDASVRLLVSNNPEAGALATAGANGIPARVIASRDFASRETFIQTLLSALREHGVEFIALAGYMKRIPDEIVRAYRNRVCNIHPALLPSFGGKGMYGRRVHEAVLEQGCKVTGVTVHLVDEEYDHGPIVAQRAVPVEEGDTAESLAERVLRIEHRLYPEVLQLFSEGRVDVVGRRAVVREGGRSPDCSTSNAR